MIATAFSLTCFAGVLFVGAVINQSLFHLLLTSIVVMLPAYLVGLLIGSMIERTLSASFDSYVESHPLPTLMDDAPDDAQALDNNAPLSLSDVNAIDKTDASSSMRSAA